MRLVVCPLLHLLLFSPILKAAFSPRYRSVTQAGCCRALTQVRVPRREPGKEGNQAAYLHAEKPPLKDAALLNEIGEEEGKKYGIRYLPSDFKKKDGYRRSIELSREYGLYRQDFCGCVYSRNERERQKSKVQNDEKRI